LPGPRRGHAPADSIQPSISGNHNKLPDMDGLMQQKATEAYNQHENLWDLIINFNDLPDVIPVGKYTLIKTFTASEKLFIKTLKTD
jgi:hypothetical protein